MGFNATLEGRATIFAASPVCVVGRKEGYLFEDWRDAAEQNFFEKLWQRRIPCAVGCAESGT